jgi:hypothetical protein
MLIDTIIVRDSEGDIIETVRMKEAKPLEFWQAEKDRCGERYIEIDNTDFETFDPPNTPEMEAFNKAFNEGEAEFFIWWLKEHHGGEVIAAYDCKVDFLYPI